MNLEAYFKSLTEELNSLKNRVRNFIADSHWLTDGEWKESVLRSMLLRNLPPTIKVGRGFIVTPTQSSTQLDIILYRHDAPTLFRDGDLVFIAPDAVLAVIEVKTRVDITSLNQAIEKLGKTETILDDHRGGALLGLYTYESNIDSNTDILGCLQKLEKEKGGRIDLLCLGTSKFIKYWQQNPKSGAAFYQKWHSYSLENTAPGYFVHNLIAHFACNIDGVSRNLWLSTDSLEQYKDGEASLSYALFNSI